MHEFTPIFLHLRLYFFIIFILLNPSIVYIGDLSSVFLCSHSTMHQPDQSSATPLQKALFVGAWTRVNMMGQTMRARKGNEQLDMVWCCLCMQWIHVACVNIIDIMTWQCFSCCSMLRNISILFQEIPQFPPESRPDDPDTDRYSLISPGYDKIWLAAIQNSSH